MSTLLEETPEDDSLKVAGMGDWVIDRAQELAERLKAIDGGQFRKVRFDLDRLETLDTVGAWLLVTHRDRLSGAGVEVELAGVRSAHQALLDQVQEAGLSRIQEERPPLRLKDLLARPIVFVGSRASGFWYEARDFVGFIGLVIARTVTVARGYQRFTFASVLNQMETGWVNALPIIGVLSFLIGLIMMYQGAVQLQRFGAQSLAVPGTTIALIWEIGALLPAILVAGRSGSAFAAQIGAMKVRQEIDAMIIFGIDPVVAIVIPRVVALVITFPLLAVYGMLVGLAGGTVIALTQLGMTVDSFITSVQQAAGLQTLAIGLVKAPFFGAIIATVGCFQGFRVSGTATEVGEHTTRAVVQSLFLVILFDAIYVVFVWLIVLHGSA